MLNGAIGICRSEGIGGIYRGLVPTVRSVSSSLGPKKPSYFEYPILCADNEARSQQYGTIRILQCVERRRVAFQADGEQAGIERDVCGRGRSGIDYSL